jgi:hypothetical protein
VAYSHWSPEHRRKVVLCPWCEGVIRRNWDAHEYLVRRASVPVARQDLIFVVENVVPMHHECHMAYGATMECKRRCLDYAIHHLGAQRIGEWYVSLWQDHGLHVPRGTLGEPPDWEAYLHSVAGTSP